MAEEKDLQMHEREEAGDQKEREVKTTQIVADYLRKLGMPAHLKGYRYTRDAITLILLNPDKDYMITKELYPEVAKKNKTTGSRVERAIRNAIEVAWERGDEDFIQEIFGNTVSSEKGKPTNSEFMAQLAEDISIKNLI